jgi:demethylmenaquinone methyltransferase/2-methoxy-6-polyprenyl-1,4-benzoquinol methylase
MDRMGMSRSEWQGIVESLEDIGADYEKVNGLMTFGLVDKWRKRVAAVAKESDVVLEIGSGPGYFTRHLSSRTIYCLEPSLDFAGSSKGMLDMSRVSLLKGVAEKIPLADNSVDKVFCVFSFRDFYDRPGALGEINRVLKEGGEAIVADVARPANGPMAKMLELHFKTLVPVLARVAIGPSSKAVWARDPYSKLMDTWLAFGSPSQNEELFRERGFSEISTEYLELKGATMTRGKKPWKSTS